MVSSKNVLLLHLICVVACVGTSSCQSWSRHPTDRRSQGDAPRAQAAQAGKGVLSKDEILKIAAAEARPYGRNAETCFIEYDQGNVHWREYVKAFEPVRVVNGYALPPEESSFEKYIQRWPQLKGHDYQVVSYWYIPAPAGDEGFWVLVDRATGKVLLTEGGD